MEYFTAMEAAVYAHKSEKTIRLWIAQGKLPAEKVAVKGLNQWSIDKRDLDRVLSTGGSSSSTTDDTLNTITGSIAGHDDLIAELINKTVELRDQINELKAEFKQALDAQRDQIEALGNLFNLVLEELPPVQRPQGTILQKPLKQRPLPPTQLPPAAQVSTALPDGLIAFRQFAGEHGIPGSTVKNAIDAGRLTCSEGEWKSGNAIIKKAFDPEQQRDFVKAYRKYHPNFHECDRKDCPCHE